VLINYVTHIAVDPGDETPIIRLYYPYPPELPDPPITYRKIPVCALPLKSLHATRMEEDSVPLIPMLIFYSLFCPTGLVLRPSCNNVQQAWVIVRPIGIFPTSPQVSVSAS